jgi:hypothetical protein
MKKILLATIISTSLITGLTKAAEKLPDGNYQLTGIDEAGNETGNILNIDVPFNDQSFSIGLICSNEKTKIVVVEQLGNVVAKYKCNR